MKSLHPASVILLCLAYLLAASTRTETTLLMLGGVSTAIAIVFSCAHLTRILRRSRWLLLTMLLLFAWMTPGTALPGLPGATQEGLLLAAESIARLLTAIATVSVLLAILPPATLVSGMRSLLAPLAGLGGFRDRLAVRLMLTLEAVEATHFGHPPASATAISLRLPVVPIGLADHIAALCSAGLIAYAVLA